MANLQKEAEALGIDVDKRWSDATLKERIARAKGQGDPANHEPAQTKETANAAGEETEADRVANRKNQDGRTNPVDFEKNTGPGPGNPDQRVHDPRDVMDTKPRDADGNVMQTEETPKVIHDTVSASGPREITNNTIPDMAERSPLVIAAEVLGIKVDPDWDDSRIKAEMQMALEGRADLQVKGAVPTQTMSDTELFAKAQVPVELTSDWWDEDGVRQSAGTSPKNLSRDQAQKLLDEGKAKRTDKLPK